MGSHVSFYHIDVRWRGMKKTYLCTSLHDIHSLLLWPRKEFHEPEIFVPQKADQVFLKYSVRYLLMNGVLSCRQELLYCLMDVVDIIAVMVQDKRLGGRIEGRTYKGRLRQVRWLHDFHLQITQAHPLYEQVLWYPRLGNPSIAVRKSRAV